MKEMVKEMMRQFRRRNHGKRPEQILFYRDGVSEGQFQTVSQQSASLIPLAHHRMHCTGIGLHVLFHALNVYDRILIFVITPLYLGS